MDQRTHFFCHFKYFTKRCPIKQTNIIFQFLLALEFLYHNSCWWVRKLEKITSLKHFKNPILTFSIEVKESNRQGKSDFLQGLNRVKFDNLATMMDPMGFKWPKLMIFYIKVWCQKLPVPKIYKLPPALSLKWKRSYIFRNMVSICKTHSNSW